MCRELVQFTEGNGKVAFLSLEELLLSVKNCGSAATSNRKERKRARSSASSSSHSDPKRCHVDLDSQICKVSAFLILWNGS